MKQTFIIVGPPVSRSSQRKIGIAQYIPPASSEKIPCRRCHQKMWVGPRQKATLQASPDLENICFACAIKDPAAGIMPLGKKGGTYINADGKIFGESGQN